MLEEYIKEIVKSELAKQKLNDMYGKNSQDLKQENEKLKKENEILQGSYNFISNNIVPELEARVTSKERIATEIGLMLNKQKDKNEKLEDKLSKVSNVISLYNTNDITFMSLMSTINNIKIILKES